MKTPIQFEYDLWTTEDNGKKKYFARVKATGEISEVSHEVMRYLRSEEKRMRRELNTAGNGSHDLSLDVLPDDETGESWLVDNHQELEESVICDMLEEEFINTLTDRQRTVYIGCMKPCESIRAYAEETGANNNTVQKVVEGIRKKYKKFSG